MAHVDGLYMSKHSRASRSPGSIALCGLLVGLLGHGAGCTDEVALHIVSPEPGSALPQGEPVRVEVVAPGQSEVLIGGRTVRGDGVFEALLDPGEGAGFVSASIPGDPLIAVRSWYQGRYVQPSEWYPGAMVTRLGGAALSGGPDSLAGVLALLLRERELVQAEVPIQIPLITVHVESAVPRDVQLELAVVDSRLTLNLVVVDTLVRYRVTGLVRSRGTALYEQIDIRADADLSVDGAVLSGVEVTTHRIRIQDESLPSFLLQAIMDVFQGQFTQAIVQIARDVAQRATRRVFEGVRPTLGLDFPRPIVEASEASFARADGSTIEVHHHTRVQAAQPEIARQDQRVLLREMSTGTGDESGTVFYLGSPLLNQEAFAIWDAGNFSGITFTKAELQELGLSSLRFPYSQLRQVTLDMGMPPLLEWAEDGPRFEVGAIEMYIEVAKVSDVLATAAASVPIRLEPMGEGVRIAVDPTRDIHVSEVMFDKLNILADREAVVSLIDRAAPGVITEVFGIIPTITLPTFSIAHIDGTPGPSVSLQLDEIHTEADRWKLGLSLFVTP